MDLNTFNQNKFFCFLEVAELLNKNLNIIPLLFGSVGLEQRLHIDLNADDIDVLIPAKYLSDKWGILYRLMYEQGYVLIDKHEHTFKRTDCEISFASIEDLKPFAGIDTSNIQVFFEQNVKYLLLSIKDYLKVYQASLKDSYRQQKKNGRDTEKIRLIQEYLP